VEFLAGGWGLRIVSIISNIYLTSLTINMTHRKIKIAYLVDFYRTDNAGTEKQLMLLLRHLPREQFEISLISIQRSPFLEALAGRLPDVEVVILDGHSDISRSLPALIKLFFLLKRIKPDILQTFFPAANSFGVMVGRLAGVPSIISSRRDLGYWYTKKDLLLTRMANLFVKRILVNSQAVKKQTLQLEKFSADKIKVIYNGIDLTDFVAIRKRRNKTAVVAIIANLNRPVKRVDLFIQAATKVLKQYPDTRFWIFGEGPLRSSLEELAHELGINNHIVFWGRPKNLIELLGQIDIGVNCSDSEGFSNAIMEYMAAGKPTIATHTGGNSELIAHQVNGLLVEPNNPEELSKSMIRLLENRKWSEQMGIQAKHKIGISFTIEEMLNNTQKFYCLVISL
jgi:glycosyltransferase involved in cell wall biosynthesis